LADLRIEEFNAVDDFEFKQLLFLILPEQFRWQLSLKAILKPASGFFELAAFAQSLLHPVRIDIPRLNALLPREKSHF